MEFAERLRDNLRRADDLVPPMREQADSLEAFTNLLIRYIRLRYLIDDTSFWTDDLRELSRFSMEHQRAAAGNGEGTLQDTSLNCAGATSAETKQILLLMKLRKDLGITLSPDYLGTARSVKDVAQKAFSQLSSETA
ncbi:hypothetical protein [Adlercreutzia faecimuris]|uniref:Uncharacterized protein n=1 Tax=Adlercreutzia faecimuris TaxID=2897341 RepID=A0ABS9WHC6_9ACTN|nr:hypothetical protein [Adlercreutzia sp. JBNU-10]MCI2242278.1 hypothetical protein [Adlercreutzia sp. JBNU-10]